MHLRIILLVLTVLLSGTAACTTVGDPGSHRLEPAGVRTEPLPVRPQAGQDVPTDELATVPPPGKKGERGGERHPGRPKGAVKEAVRHRTAPTAAPVGPRHPAPVRIDRPKAPRQGLSGAAAAPRRTAPQREARRPPAVTWTSGPRYRLPAKQVPRTPPTYDMASVCRTAKSMDPTLARLCRTAR